MKKKILLVEDEAIIAMTTSKILEKHDFEVVTVHNGEKAIATVDKDLNLSLILMDINLGKGIDGTEAAQEILKNHDIPIIFHTSHSEKEYVDLVKKITRYGYILKNSGKFVLIEAITMAFELFEANQQTQKREETLKHEKKRLQEYITIIEERKRIDEKRNKHLLELYDKFDLSQPDILDYVLGASLEITNSQFAFSGFINEDETVMTIHRWSTEAMHDCSISDKPIEFPIENAGIWGDCIRERKPIIINDYQNNTRSSKHGTPNGHVTIKRFLCVPIFHETKIVAVGAAANKALPYNNDDADALAIIYDKMWSLLKQQQADRQLKESEQRWLSLVENNPDFIAIHDSAGRFLYMNRYAEGFLEEDVIGTSVYEYMSEESKQLFQQKEKACLETWSMQKFEHRAAGDKGIFSWYENFLVPIVENETEKRIIVVSRDITKRKQLEQELRESERNAHITLNSIGDAVISTDIDGKVLRMNPAAEALTGWSVYTAKGKILSEVFHIINADTREIVDNPVGKVLESGETVGLANHTVLISRDGQEYQIADSAAPIKDDEGNINGVVLVFRDVTEEYKKEQQIRERVKELNCLYKIGEIVEEPNASLRNILQKTAEIVPQSWRYPETCECRITVHSEKFQSTNFSETKWQLCSEIIVENIVVGEITVCYLDERPTVYDGPFLAEERRLLDAIAERLGRIIERRQAEENLHSIEWMLSSKSTKQEDYISEYGDVSELNKDGLILNSVGREQLKDIASEYLDLLETSTAIYEKNGDYALGIFSSGWCQLMDSASRRLCKTEDNQKALESGDWLCHESCWKDASLAMVEGKAVEIECNGGIKMYAVPVRANGEVVGAINFGYGNPPTDETELKKFSALYDIPIEILRKNAEAYKPRPQFIIDYAKERIQTAAKNLGYMIERTCTKEKLSQDEHYLRTILQTTVDGFWLLDSQGNLIDVNDAYCQMLGYSKEELLHMSIEDLDAVERREDIESRIQRIIKNGSETFETKHRHKNGSVLDIEIATTLLNIDGVQFVCFCRDITERKQTEETLFIKTMALESSMNAIAIADMKGTLIYVNPSFIKMWGYQEKKDIIGMQSTAFWESKNQAEQVKRAVVENQKWIGELKAKRKDGYLFDTQLSVSIILNDSNEPQGMLASFLDITERKQAEQDLRESQERFQILHNASFGGITIHDKGVILDCNQGLSDITGFSYDELVGMDGLLLIAFDWRGFVSDKITSGYEDPYEAEGIRKDKSIYPLRLHGKKISYKGKQVRVVEFRDISEQKKIEEQQILLNATSNEMLEIDDRKKLYDYIVTQLHSIYPEAYVIYLSVNETKTKVRIESIKGIEDDILYRIATLFGYKLLGKEYEIDERMNSIFNSDKLTYLKEGIIELSSNVLSSITARQVQKIAGIKETYAIGILKDKQLIGAIHIFCRKPSELKNNSTFVDSFIHQASIILNKKQLENQLRSSLKEKDSLMKELNHRVKNNIALVSALISLKESETEIDLSSLKHRIEVIKLVHEKLYQQNNIEQIEVEEYFQELVEAIFYSSTNRNVDIINTIEEVSIPTKMAIPLGLIVNEIATNAIKYGFIDEEKARFTIDLKKESESKHYILTLSNTGNPFPEETGLDSPKTMGLQLISTLVQQLNGTIELQKKPYPVFTIRFPLGKE